MDSTEMTCGHRLAWSRLQRISIYHAGLLYQSGSIKRQYCGRHRGQNLYQVSVPEVIRENVAILGRGTEEEVKYRLNWYVEFFPTVFSAS